MKRLIIHYEDFVEHCGACYHDVENKCELTGSPIEDHWNGTLPDCPLDEVSAE